MPVIGGTGSHKHNDILDETDLARFIFRKYCGSNQYIPHDNLKFLFRDLYNNAHQYLEEIDMDKAVDELYRILDMDKDGKVTLRDIETLVSTKGFDPNNTALMTKINAIRQEKYMQKLDNMKKSFETFSSVNYKLAKEIFNAYDTEGTGYIEKQDLPLVLIDTCTHLGLSTDLDRELLMTSIEAFNFRTKNRISQKEFEFLYTMKFNM